MLGGVSCRTGIGIGFWDWAFGIGYRRLDLEFRTVEAFYRWRLLRRREGLHSAVRLFEDSLGLGDENCIDDIGIGYWRVYTEELDLSNHVQDGRAAYTLASLRSDDYPSL